jgi:hypothetical protein
MNRGGGLLKYLQNVSFCRELEHRPGTIGSAWRCGRLIKPVCRPESAASLIYASDALPQQPSQKSEKLCRVLNGVFRAVVASTRSFATGSRCKRLIKNCIICWNYLYLSQKVAGIDDPAKREELLQAMAHGSAAAWGHLNHPA